MYIRMTKNGAVELSVDEIKELIGADNTNITHIGEYHNPEY